MRFFATYYGRTYHVVVGDHRDQMGDLAWVNAACGMIRYGSQVMSVVDKVKPISVCKNCDRHVRKAMGW